MMTKKLHISKGSDAYFLWDDDKEMWDKLLVLFKKWPYGSTDLSLRRRYFETVYDYVTLKLSDKSYFCRSTKVPLNISKNIPDRYFCQNGPIELMIITVIKSPLIFKSSPKVLLAGKKRNLILSKRKVYCLFVLGFFMMVHFGHGNENPYDPSKLFYNVQYTKCILGYIDFVWKKALRDAKWLDKEIFFVKNVGSKKQRDNKTIYFPDYMKSNKLVSQVKIENKKIGIEDFRKATQVIFADKDPGGTILTSHPDIVQEEIMFLVYPELFVTILLSAPLKQSDILFVKGVTRINNYTGYKNTFQYTGPFIADYDDIDILFIDAISIKYNQNESLNIINEMNKAYVGFISCDPYKFVATGHWGCGAFGGNPAIKSVIQIIAASEAQRNLIYTTYGVPIEDFESFYGRLVKNNATVKDIYIGLDYALKNYPDKIYRGIIKYIENKETIYKMHYGI